MGDCDLEPALEFDDSEFRTPGSPQGTDEPSLATDNLSIGETGKHNFAGSESIYVLYTHKVISQLNQFIQTWEGYRTIFTTKIRFPSSAKNISNNVILCLMPILLTHLMLGNFICSYVSACVTCRR